MGAKQAATVLQKTGDNALLTPDSRKHPNLSLVRAIVGDPIPLDPCSAPWNAAPRAARRPGGRAQVDTSLT